jgi:hypothetical protein
MNEAELLAEFVRVEVGPGGVQLFVREIHWEGQTPASSWTPALTLPREASEPALTSAKRSLLADARFFGRCRECGENLPIGWMNDDICHSCLERNHGAVF